MEFAFDAFRRVFELVLNTEFIPGMNMLEVGLLVLTLWSAFRFFIFPLFSKEDLSRSINYSTSNTRKISSSRKKGK